MGKVLNTNEKKVLASMLKSSAGNGHDFGLTCDVKVAGLTGKQVGGYMQDLRKKRFAIFYGEIIVNENDKYVQFTLEPDAFEAMGLPRDTYTNR